MIGPKWPLRVGICQWNGTRDPGNRQLPVTGDGQWKSNGSGRRDTEIRRDKTQTETEMKALRMHACGDGKWNNNV